jgi:putative ABC transport system permease protein
MRERRLSREVVRLPVKSEVDDELAFHVAMRAREFEARGYSPHEAEAEALRMFRELEQVRAECIREGQTREREMSRAEYLVELVQDFRFALRQFARARGFAASTVLILALGIGCVTLMFSVANVYLLRPLPYPNAERLVFVGSGAPTVDWRTPQNVFSEVGAWDLDAFTMVGSGEPEELLGSWVNAGFFRALGVKPALGRFFTDDENRPGGPSVAVISHAVWQSRFAGDVKVLGKTFRAYASDNPEEAELYTVVGVLPQDFWSFFPFAQVFAPLRGERTVTMALLRPGVTASDASRVVTGLRRATAGAKAAEITVESVQARYAAEVKPKVVVLLGAVVLLLLIACANAAVLLLVRAGAREDEFSTRIALGAGRGRIARQLIVEGLALASAAGVLGIALAQLGAKSLGPIIEARLGRAIPGGAAALTLDWRVALAALAATVVCGCVFGLVPLFARGRGSAESVLTSARRVTESRTRQRLRSVLITGEVALSLALLTSAGLLVRSAWHLLRQDLGFSSANTFTAYINMRQARYPTDEARIAFYERLLARVQSESGVTGATLAQTIPFGEYSRGTETLEAEGQLQASAQQQAVLQLVHDSYLRTMNIPVVRGRGFEKSDRGGEPVALVSSDLAQRLWPGGNPIGQRLRTAKSEYAEAGEWMRVIGVAAPVINSLRAQDPPEVYVSMTQATALLTAVVVRTRANPADVGPAFRRIVSELDPEIPVTNPTTMRALVGQAQANSAFLAAFLAGFAAFALLLAVFGLYAVIAYNVEQERKAIAIRMVVGATVRDVVRLVMRRGVAITVAGLAAGSILGVLVTTQLQRRLDSVQGGSIAVFALQIMVLALAALAAMWVPARRAARTDPASALRS